jgi:hypothetical protein
VDWSSLAILAGFLSGGAVAALHFHLQGRRKPAHELADALRHEPKLPPSLSALPPPGVTVQAAFTHMAERVDELTLRVEEMERRGR